MENPKKLIDEFRAMSQTASWKIRADAEVLHCWDVITELLSTGSSKKSVWAFLHSKSLFLGSYSSFLRGVKVIRKRKEEERKQQAQAERRAKIEQQKQSEEDRLKTIMDQYEK